MKQYVLDEPGAQPLNAASLAPSIARRRWRWAVLLPAIGAAALVAAYSVVEGRSEPASRPTGTPVVPAYVASTVVAEPAHAAVVPEPPAVSPATPPSRITHVDGRYVVDLHAAALGSTLAMLSEATRATVTGSDMIVSSPSRITTSFIADSPLDAWKGVFGDVANFALTCGHSACAVRFVSLVGVPAASSLSARLAQVPRPTSMAPPAAPSTVDANGEPVPDN